jgi:hypothetical protein
MRFRLVIAEAAETKPAPCSASTFAGLLAFALLGWTDRPSAGFITAGFAIKEGR